MVLLENKMQEASATLLKGKSQDEDADMVSPSFRQLPNLVETPGEKKKNNLGFEYAEHSYIGDTITLTLADKSKINGLAGDFYGTFDPICKRLTQDKQKERFIAAYNTLAGPNNRPDETSLILLAMNQEVNAVNAAIAANEDPSVAYSKLPSATVMGLVFESITALRFTTPRYLELAEINFDHFGQDARTAYEAGHSAALAVAVAGDLEKAYSMNAFADHFLEDLFSAGHLRTPRRMLSGDLGHNLCAKYMHDEENAIGLTVKNPAGEAWKCFGDKRALDFVNSDNQKRCLAAIQTSASEIYEAFSTRKLPDQYRAWAHAPTLKSVSEEKQQLSPLFIGEKRRTELTDRRTWEHSGFWVALVTAGKCYTSGWWNNPITIDGPKGVLNGSGVAATATEDGKANIYFQDAEGLIIEKRYDEKYDSWSRRDDWTFRPKLFSPLAAINYDSGSEVGVYCISNEGLLEEWRHRSSVRGWYPGALSERQFRPAYNTKLAVLRWDDHNYRVFAQDKDNKIQEYIGPDWKEGQKLPAALAGTSLAAVCYKVENENKICVRVYYQAPDMTLKEHCMDNFDGNWFEGNFKTEKMPPCAPIAALRLRVYCQNEGKNIIGYKCEPGGGWTTDGQVVAAVPPGGFTSVLEWGGSGNNKRFYYQADDNRLYDQRQTNGQAWSRGSVIPDGVPLVG